MPRTARGHAGRRRPCWPRGRAPRSGARGSPPARGRAGRPRPRRVVGRAGSPGTTTNGPVRWTPPHHAEGGPPDGRATPDDRRAESTYDVSDVQVTRVTCTSDTS